MAQSEDRAPSRNLGFGTSLPEGGLDERITPRRLYSDMSKASRVRDADTGLAGFRAVDTARRAASQIPGGIKGGLRAWSEAPLPDPAGAARTRYMSEVGRGEMAKKENPRPAGSGISRGGSGRKRGRRR
jgi:hypothetical protein